MQDGFDWTDGFDSSTGKEKAKTEDLSVNETKGCWGLLPLAQQYHAGGASIGHHTF